MRRSSGVIGHGAFPARTRGERFAITDPAKWGAAAEDYERWGEPMTSPFVADALSLSGGIVSGERILDVAAGTGALTLAAASRGAQVLAVDFSPGMVSRLQVRLETVAGAVAQVMDGQALTLADGTFDATFSLFGVMLFTAWRRGLSEIARGTRPGGRVVVSSWASSEGAGPFALLLPAYRVTFPDAAVPVLPEGLRELVSQATFRAEMHGAGCHDVTVNRIGRSWNRPSVDHAMEDMASILRLSPVYAGLGKGDRAQLDVPLRDAVERHADPEGHVSVPVQAHIAVGHIPR